MNSSSAFGSTEITVFRGSVEDFADFLEQLYQMVAPEVASYIESVVEAVDAELTISKQNLLDSPNSEYFAGRVTHLEEQRESKRAFLESEPDLRLLMTARDGLSQSLTVSLSDFRTIQSEFSTAKRASIDLPVIPTSSSFHVSVSKGLGIEVRYSAADPETARNLANAAKARLRQFRPWWWWAKSMVVTGALSSLVGLSVIQATLASSKSVAQMFASVGVVAAIIMLGVASIPRVKFVGEKRDWLLTGKGLLKWAIGAVAAGFIGALISRALG